MSQVNLLPRGVREKAKARNQAILVGIGGAALVGLLVIIYLLSAVQLRQAQNDLGAQKAVNAGLQGQVNALMQWQDLADELEVQQGLIATALQGEVAWSGQLADLQYVMGQIGEITLTQFTGTVDVVTGETLETPTIGKLTLAGESEGTQRLARFVSKAAEVNGWGNPWLTNATRTELDRYEFVATVDLFSSAETPAGQGATPGTAGEVGQP